MNKKNLQIQTNFLDDDQEQEPQLGFDHVYEQKIKATIEVEKILSLILAKNFIDCWDILKSSESWARRDSSRGRPLMNWSQAYARREGELESQYGASRLRYRNLSEGKNIKVQRSYSGQRNYEHIPRNRSLKVVNLEIQGSRVRILQEIVDKLSSAKKNVRLQVEQQEVSNREIIKRISNIEKLVRGIRNETQREVRSTVREHYYVNNSKYSRSAYRKQESSEQEHQLMNLFEKEIKQLQLEIKQIKANNEAIMRTELSRSQANSTIQINPGHSSALKYVSLGVQTSNLKQKSKNAKIVAEQSYYQTKTLPHTNFHSSDVTNLNPSHHLAKSNTDATIIHIQVPSAGQPSTYSKTTSNSYIPVSLPYQSTPHLNHLNIPVNHQRVPSLTIPPPSTHSRPNIPHFNVNAPVVGPNSRTNITYIPQVRNLQPQPLQTSFNTFHHPQVISQPVTYARTCQSCGRACLCKPVSTFIRR